MASEPDPGSSAPHPRPGNIPIETDRLTLHAPRLEDFAESAAMWSDPEVTRFIGGRPCSEEETWARLLRYAGHWSLMGFGYWVVREKASGRFAGEVGFADFRREILPSIAGQAEIGWILSPGSQGRGLATEAVHAALAWGEVHLRGSRTVCLIHPENSPSLRVAEKCGYRESIRTTYKDLPTIIFHR